MYHPTTLGMAASYHQEELLREARNARLAREATGGDHHTSAQHRVVAVAVLVLLALAVVVLI
jgi:hypothetical protein